MQTIKNINKVSLFENRDGSFSVRLQDYTMSRPKNIFLRIRMQESNTINVNECFKLVGVDISNSESKPIREKLHRRVKSKAKVLFTGANSKYFVLFDIATSSVHIAPIGKQLITAIFDKSTHVKSNELGDVYNTWAGKGNPEMFEMKYSKTISPLAQAQVEIEKLKNEIANMQAQPANNESVTKTNQAVKTLTDQIRSLESRNVKLEKIVNMYQQRDSGFSKPVVEPDDNSLVDELGFKPEDYVVTKSEDNHIDPSMLVDDEISDFDHLASLVNDTRKPLEPVKCTTQEIILYTDDTPLNERDWRAAPKTSFVYKTEGRNGSFECDWEADE